MGLLITIEGGEFTGKTSVVIPALKTVFEHCGIETLTSREPGGTARGEEIRQEIFAKLKEGATAHELATLFNKARRIHLDEVIIPFLGENKEHPKIVLLDRYLDSTRIYQGLEAGVPMKEIKTLEEKYVQGYFPDLTLLMHFPENQFKQTFTLRKTFADQQTNNRDVNEWDEANLEKHIARQHKYLQCPDLARQWNESRAFELINAAQHPHEVIKDAALACLPFLKIVKNTVSSTQLEQTLRLLKTHELWQELNSYFNEQQSIAQSMHIPETIT